MGPPQSSKEAEKNEVLIHRYTPSRDFVVINNKRYSIEDSWTSYRLPERNTHKINRKGFEFLIVLKDESTGELSTDHNFSLPIKNFIYKGKKYGYTNGIGNSSGMLAIDFRADLKPSADDTIQFSVLEDTGIKSVLFFKN